MPDSHMPEPNRNLAKVAQELREDLSDPTLKKDDVTKDDGLSFSSNYRFVSDIAEGGIKKIKRMTELRTGRDVAIAQLKENLVTPVNIERFLREAKTLAHLEHPGIVPLYEINYDDNDLLYFSMKLLSGETLASILKKIRDEELAYTQKYSTRKLLGMLMQICDAIAFAHSKSIAHLDIKPENIQISDYGEVLVLDWGFAKHTDKSNPLPYDSGGPALFTSISENLTQIGTVNGTPGYMSPEQASNDDTVPGTASDIYSLGAVLYSLITLCRPYENVSASEAIENTRNGSPLDYHTKRKQSSSLDKTLIAICKKAMANNPDERYNNVLELKNDIDAYLNNFSTEAEKLNTFQLLHLFYKRNQKACFAATLLILAISTSLYLHTKLEVNKEKEIRRTEATYDEILEGTWKKEKDLRFTFRFKEALKQYKQLTDVGYDQATLWYRRARLHAGELELEQAIECLSQLKELKRAPRKNENPERNKKRLLLNLSKEYLEISKSRALTPKDIIRFGLDSIDDDLQRHLIWNINQDPKIGLKEKIELLNYNMKLFNIQKMPDGPNLKVSFKNEKLILNFSKNNGLRRITPIVGLPVERLNISHTSVNFQPEYTFVRDHVPELIMNNTPNIYREVHLRDGHNKKVSVRNAVFMAFHALAFCPELEHLDVEGSEIDSDLIKVSDSLKYLNVARTNFSQFKILLDFPKLKTLVLSKSMNVPSDILKQLKQFGVDIIYLD